MEEQLRECILSGNTDEKQFFIGNKVITVNPKKNTTANRKGNRRRNPKCDK